MARGRETQRGCGRWEHALGRAEPLHGVMVIARFIYAYYIYIYIYVHIHNPTCTICVYTPRLHIDKTYI